MLYFVIEFFLLIVSSLIALSFVYFKVPLENIQQVIGIFVIILLIVSNRFVLTSSKPVPVLLRLFLVLLISSSVQLVVISSGGFRSPFLILFHLFAISASFLLHFRTGIGFLSFSLITLILSTFLDPRLRTVTDDPWSIVLYVLSFVTLIPLYQLVVSRYKLKDILSHILSSELEVTSDKLNQTHSQLELTKIHEESLLGSISDVVVVTDLQLRVLSFNDIAGRILNLSQSQYLGVDLFSVITLRTSDGQMANQETLSIAQVIKEKSMREIKNLLLYTKMSTFPKKVSVKVRPTTDLNGNIDQLVFVITGNWTEYLNQDQSVHNTSSALLRQQSSLNEFKKMLLERNLADLWRKAELISKVEKDILAANEIEHHGLTPKLALVDLAELLQQLIIEEKLFAESFNVNLKLEFDPQFVKRFSTVSLEKGETYTSVLTQPYFSIPSDLNWTATLLEKLLDIVVLLSSSTSAAQVVVRILYDQEKVTVTVEGTSPTLPADFQNLLQAINYGSIGEQTNLKLGSGLEGYLIKNINSILKNNLGVNYNSQTSIISLSLQISKKPIA